jgi:hypothetical protein
MNLNSEPVFSIIKVFGPKTQHAHVIYFGAINPECIAKIMQRFSIENLVRSLRNEIFNRTIRLYAHEREWEDEEMEELREKANVRNKIEFDIETEEMIGRKYDF